MNGHLPKTPGRVVVLVATTAGLYLFHGDDCRATWRQSGPYLEGRDVHHAAFDPRDGALWAAANGPDARVFKSRDGGATWESKGEAFVCDAVWHVEPGHAQKPGSVFAGVKPAALYRSDDDGETWRPVEGLNNHETRPEWWEGGGGLCLHTIILPPERPGRIFAGVSVAGLFRSDDDGATWAPVNDGVADFLDEVSENGVVVHRTVHRCVHKVVIHPTNPDVMFQQNHQGVYRSDDAGESWQSINYGLPTDFGFPIAIGAGDRPAIFVVPQDGTKLPIRTTERLAVWRSVDEGRTWVEATAGLPTGQLNVLREAMTADDYVPAGVYVGAQSGSLYSSTDEGATWTTLAEDLPSIRSVKIAYNR